jgi:hypothetical protein
MQPRQGVEVPKESPAEVSGVEVQPEVPKEAVLEGVGGDSEGEGLALESVQNLESKPQKEVDAAENPENGVIVAQTGDSASLEEQLQRSAEGGVPAELAGLEPTTWPTYGGIERGPAPADINKTLPLDGEGETLEVDKINVKVYRKTPDGEYVEMPGAEDWLASNAPGSRLSYHPPMGPLSSGDTRSTVLVREGYWEGVESAAKADGVSVEEWLTRELGERLEDTFFGRR